MSKRFAESDGREPRDHKRTKTQPPVAVIPATDIFSARQLQDLLSFSQDAVQDLRNAIQSFKQFLELILYEKDEPNRPAKINILNDYLDAAKLRAARDKDAEYLPDFMQAWSFANQTNNDYLISSVSSILALLLKTLATLVDSREYGILLIKTLLNHAQLKLISRGVSAPKHKEHVISPCLRILTEMVSFDAGLMAKQVYSKRDFTFETKIVARNLCLVKSGSGPSVRSNAIRYLLANFKYQGEGAKIDILKNGHITKALFDHLKDDTADALQEIFKTLELNILRDETIPRATKSHTISERSLSGVLAALRTYATTESPTGDDSTLVRAKTAIIAFLKLVSTTPSLGLLRSSGWYPPGSERHTRDQNDEAEADLSLDLGLDSVDWYNKFTSQVPVRNTILSGFSQTLKPYASEEERDIILSIFTAAPEIIADYFFSRGEKFSFEPKLTNTWIGYASFLFSSIQVPFPKYFGAQNHYASCPPPVSVAIENILPLPLTQRILTKSLNQSSDLITLFTVRILVVAFQKLKVVLQAFNAAAAEGGSLWKEGAIRLIAEFSQRCPHVKDVIAAFRQIPDDNILQKEAISRLLRMYYQVTPQAALEEKFDVSQALTVAMARVEVVCSDSDNHAFRLLELQHLLVIAQCSAGMRWWHKQGSLKYSPFTTLLRLSAQTSTNQSTGTEFINLLQSVIDEHGILQQQTKESSLNALIASLMSNEAWKPSDSLYTFIDECLGRLVRKPIKYLDDLDEIAGGSDHGKVLSVLVMVCLEQVPFTSKFSETDRENVLMWLSRFLEMLKITGEDKGLLQIIRQRVSNLPVTSSVELEPTLRSIASRRSADEEQISAPALSDEKSTKQPLAFSEPPVEKQNHPELFRWQQKDLEEALENGDIDDLILCLSSKDSSVRLQAQVAIRKLMARVKASTNDDKDQIYLLLGELSETVAEMSPPIAQQSLPYIASVFATQALAILQDPSHFMYAKINKYLNKGPVWNVGKLANYWVDRTLLETPDEDDKHWAEIEFVLDFIMLGTRTLQDVHLLLPRNCMEKILDLFASPSAPKAVKDAVLKVAYRVAAVGGATSLVTRTGVLAWLEMRSKVGDVDAATLDVLKRKVSSGLDETRVKTWSKGALMADGGVSEMVVKA
jgi:nucleolar pre-ribosomal-associated protein 1